MTDQPQLPEDSHPSSVPPPGAGAGGYGAGGFSAPVGAAAAFGAPVAAADVAYASRWMRLAAYIIDGVIVGAVAFVIGLIVGATGSTAPYLLFWALSLFYAPLLLMRTGENNGQTIGKQAVGIRVVHEQGGPMTLGRAALREIVGKTILGLVTCGLYAILDALWCLWDPKRQCLHDKVGSTYVVNA